MDSRDTFSASLNDEGRYRLLIDAIDDYAIYMLDLEGRVTSWNPGAERFKGYRADEIIGSHFSRFYTDEDRAAGLPEEALRLARTEGRFEREGWRVRKDGARFWAHVVIDPIRTPAGDFVGYAKVTRDLSERRAAEDALRRSEQEFRLLVQAVTDYAIYMLSPSGRVTNWNAGAERIKGYRPQEIIGEHFSRFYTEEDRAAGLPAQNLRRAGQDDRFETEGWRLRKDGSRFWAHVVIDAIRNDAGELIGFAKITRDITERREAQTALEAAREALFQSQKMDAIGQLTGGIAHDFNNLLMVVISGLDMLRKRLPPDPKITSLLDNVMQGAERGAALTQQMLSFARKQEMKLKPVALPDLVDGMGEMLRRSLGPEFRLAINLPANLPPVLSDENQLASALLNLAVNARDAMPDGGEIAISAEVIPPEAGAASGADERFVVLSISDTGEGMDEETLAKAVEPFFTTKGIGKGTGLGLPMVHGLAAQSGGRLVLKSRKGDGTTAQLWLPVAGAEIAAAAPVAILEDISTPSLLILAVDDDSLVLTSTTAMLEDLGHRVVKAGSGAEALTVLRANPDIALIITDQAMPQMTGAQLRDAIQARRPDLPVLLATGFVDLPAGADPDLPRLAKPFTQAQLAQEIARMAARGTPALVP
ncbi:MAG TPA: PAS domain S-box protein [Phenylobacterium sp.]|nr:PAS domain S-box protein [Phenylobacterium sp.]